MFHVVYKSAELSVILRLQNQSEMLRRLCSIRCIQGKGLGTRLHFSGPGRSNQQLEVLTKGSMVLTKGLITIAASIGGIVYGTVVYKHFQHSSVDYNVKRASSKLATSKFTFEEPPKYIHRNQVVSELREVVRRSHTIHYAIVVTGPRGSGKTTLLHELVNGETGVGTPLPEATFDYFASRVLSLIKQDHTVFTPQGITKLNFLHSVLQDMKEKGHKPPLFVIELDERCTGRDLEKLLLYIKAWGYEDKLARFILVLSTSQSAFGTQIGLRALRANCVAVSDLSESEAEKYVQKLFGMDTFSLRGDIEDLVRTTVSLIGTRILDLAEIEIHIPLHEVHVADVEAVIKAYEAAQVQGYVAGHDLTVRRVPEVFDDLKNKKTVYVTDFCIKNGVDIEEFIATLAEIRPHALYACPSTGQLTFGSHFMWKVVP